MNHPTTYPSAIFAYVHHNRRVAALVTLRCQTDFALRCDVVQEFGNRLAQHAAATGGAAPEAAWIFSPAKTIADMLAELKATLREDLQIAQVHVQS